MKDLLFLTQRIPYPPIKGEKIRPLQILRHLSKEYRIHLGCLIDDKHDWKYVDEVNKYCVDTYYANLNPKISKILALRALITGDPLSVIYFYNRGLAQWVEKVLTNIRPSVVFVCSSNMAQYVLNSNKLPCASIVDFADVDSDKFRQYSKKNKWPMSYIYAREARVLLEYDRAVAKQFGLSTFVSNNESELFKKLSPENDKKITYVESGVDSEYFDPNRTYENILDNGYPSFVFTGTMDYWPNVDAVVWFANEIFTAIRKEYANALFYIVGANPSREVCQLNKIPGVVVTGRVPDVRPYVAQSTCAVAPLRVARGVQNKVLEAMAMSKTVVATPNALGGIDAKYGEEVLVVDSAEEFIRTLLEISSKPELNNLGESARRRVLSEYSWPAKMQNFDRYISELLAN